MKRTKLWYVFAISSLVFTLGCDRHASSKASITLQVPKELQEKVGSQSVSGLNLVHLALQISGPGLTQTYQKIVDAGDGNSIPDTVTIDDLPSGDNRVIQLLAAYAAADSDSAHVYYGDVTQSLKNATEVVSVPIAKLGGSGASTMARVTGRYLTSNLSGPYGTIDMIYRPAGKPAIPVDKKKIIGGWFEVSTFADVPVDFVISSMDGASNGLIVGSQWINSSFTPSNQLIKFTIPAGFEEREENGATVFKAMDAEEQVFGYFSANASFLSDKKICVTSKTQEGGGTVHLGSLMAADKTTARVLKYYPTGTTPVFANSQVTLAGGIDKSTCGTLLAQDEFHKYLWYLPQYTSGQYNRHDDFASSLGISESFVGPVRTNPYDNFAFRGKLATMAFFPFSTVHRSATLLPGMEYAMDGVRVYEISPNSHGDDRCDRLDANTYVFKKSISPLVSGHTIAVRNSDLPAIGLSHEYGLCLSVKGEAVGRLLRIGPMVNAPVPADLIYSSIYNGAQGYVGYCKPVSIEIASNNPSWYLPYQTVAATLSATTLGVADPVIYTDPLCATTPTSSIATTILSPESSKTFFFKPTSTDTTIFDVSNVTPSIPLGVNTSAVVANLSSTPDTFDLTTDQPHQAFSYQYFETAPDSCIPLRVSPRNAANPATYDSTVTFSLVDINEAVYSSSNVRFFDSCAPTATELSGGILSFSGQSYKTLGVKITSPLKDIKIKLYSAGGVVSKTFVMNPIPLAHHLTMTGSAMSTGQCVPVTITAREANGNAKNVARNLNFYMSSAYTDVHYYSSASCSTVYNSFTIAAGTSSKTVYVKSYKSGSLPIYPYLNNTYEIENFTSFPNTTIAPGPLAIFATPFSGSPTVNTTASFEITGGSAPYTVQTTNPTYFNSISIIASSDKYLLQVQFAGVGGGPIPIHIVDSNGTPAMLPITIAP